MSKNFKTYFIASISIVILLALTFAIISLQSERGDEKIVSATFYPIYDITSAVVGDNYKVVSIIPSGVEPHDYEPTPSNARNIANSIVLFGLGLEFSEIEEKLIKINPGMKYVVVTSGLDLIKGDHEHEEEGEHEEENEHEESEYDSHVWLSPKRMINITEKISGYMSEIDPKNSDRYNSNAQEYINKLNDLDKSFEEGLRNCETRIIFVNHAAFGYLAEDYGLEQFAISGLSPDTEPSPQKLKELVELAREKQIRYIFYEELADPRVSRAIANEVGAQTLELNPVEGSSSGEDYFSIMERNLNNLKIALSC